MNDDLLSLPELVAAVAEAMAAWPAPTNGQVRPQPDLRTLRWYGTIGLLDKPLAWRGRTALYGMRHLRQVLAIKRLQLAGWPIAAIQQRLYGVADPDLIAVAGDEVLAPAPPVLAEGAAPVAKAEMEEADGESDQAAPSTPAPKRRRDEAFWSASANESAPSVPVTIARLHIPLGVQAELVLPASMDTAGLEQALAPLRAWLVAHPSAVVTPDVTAVSPTRERTP